MSNSFRSPSKIEFSTSLETENTPQIKTSWQEFFSNQIGLLPIKNNCEQDNQNAINYSLKIQKKANGDNFPILITGELLAPFLSQDESLASTCLDWQKIAWQELESQNTPELKTQSDQITNLSRYKRYANGEKVSAKDDFDKVLVNPHILTMIATMPIGNKEVVLATVGLDHPDNASELELTKFFTFENQNGEHNDWPYKKNNLQAMEYCQFAFSPIFDILEKRSDKFSQILSRKYQQAISARFFHEFQQKIDSKNSWIGCTMVENVKKFVEEAGFEVTPLTSAKIDSNNPYYQSLHEEYPFYFEHIQAFGLDLDPSKEFELPADIIVPF